MEVHWRLPSRRDLCKVRVVKEEGDIVVKRPVGLIDSEDLNSPAESGQVDLVSRIQAHEEQV